MVKCEQCGKAFDRDDAADEFDIEYGSTQYLSYDCVRPCLCGTCAIQAIEDGEDGVYFETCEKCGCEFDLAMEEVRFKKHFSWFNGTSLTDHWNKGIKCADCVIEEIEKNKV